MANTVALYRGGSPDFKGWFRRGDWPEFTPPFGTPPMPATPPYNSHADAAHGQGYLNLHFPLVPRLADTTAHFWMGEALKGLSAVGDKIYTNWIPQRSFVKFLQWELCATDAALDGVYVKPIADRVFFNFDSKQWEYETNTKYETMLNNASVTQFPLGTPADDDARYFAVENTDIMCTYGHDIPKLDPDTGAPTEGWDEYFGSVLLGYEITEGDPEKIALIYKSNFALYFSCKCFTFEGSTQV